MAQKRQSIDQAQQMEAAVKETVQNFQHELDGMLAQVTNTMEDLKKSGITNGNQLKTEYGKGFADIQAQLNKATADMMSAYTKSYMELKGSLKDNYDGLYGQAKSNIDKNMQRFKTTVPPVLLHIPGPQQKVFQDTIKGMDESTARTLKSLEDSYKDMMVTVDKTYQEGLKSMQLQSGLSGQAQQAARRLSKDAPNPGNPLAGTSKPPAKK